MVSSSSKNNTNTKNTGVSREFMALTREKEIEIYLLLERWWKRYNKNEDAGNAKGIKSLIELHKTQPNQRKFNKTK